MSDFERREETVTFEKLLKDLIKDASMKLYVSFPAMIQEYDPATQSATVEIMLKKKYTLGDEKGVERPPLLDVPVHHSAGNGGKKFLHIPLVKGDLGMVLFSDRSLDLYLAGDGVTKTLAGNSRSHSLSDGWFIAGVQPFAKALEGVNARDTILQNESTKITMKDSTIAIDNGTNELIAVLEELANWLKNDAMTLTQSGPQPFIGSSLALLTPIIDKLSSFKVV